jgi:hypothetical protein
MGIFWEFMMVSLKPGSALREAPRCTADEFRALLRRGNLTGAQAAAIAGVNPRTIRRWVGGASDIPYSAWRLIETQVDQEAMIAEAQSDHAAWIEAQDASSLNEKIAFYREIQSEQHHLCGFLENALAERQRSLQETTRILNALLAER